MKAAILYGKEDVRVEDVPLKPLRPGEVRIGIEAALTCGTDLKVYRRGYHAKMIVPPAVFGHELSGTVIEVGEGVTAWKAGDRVVAANSAPCGSCFHCREGQENLCDDLVFLNGAYAEAIVVPPRLVQKNLLRLKAQTGFREAALVEPLACVAQGLSDLRLRLEQRVLVLGAGPIGLMFTVLARRLGCLVTVAGRGATRLETAHRLGAGQVVDLTEATETVAAVRDQTRGPFDVVIEAVGKPEAWQAAVQLVRKGGKVNFFGGCPAGATITLDTGLIHYSNLALLASFHHTPRTVRQALALIEEGAIRAEDFVNGEWPLSQLPDVFKNMAAGNRAVKTLIDVHQ